MSVLSALLNVPMDYSRFQNSFAPLYSSYAVCLDGKFPGVNITGKPGHCGSPS